MTSRVAKNASGNINEKKNCGGGRRDDKVGKGEKEQDLRQSRYGVNMSFTQVILCY